ncbi:MAG: peroxide stress protein YaaA [Lachnospiraceae bacterium]|nr:peroxide stress protein YaaA [Lachnospiraceae bacterium]
MRIIISPAKKMNHDSDTLAAMGLPVFLSETEKILNWLRGQSPEALQKLWGCNDKIAAQNVERITAMELKKNLTPAILSYEGIQYQYMAPAVFEEKMLAYVQKHLRILSGFYGVVKPMDGVTPYRLEMQAKADIEGRGNLYTFWEKKIYDEVMGEDRVIINLASKEYSQCVEKYLQPQDTFITCVFGEFSGKKVVQKGTYAKMARGEMVRFLAEKGADRPEAMKDFDRLNYRFHKELSTADEYVFIRETIEE